MLAQEKDSELTAFTPVLERVLRSYPPEKIKEPLYRDLYQQVVMRCVADVAGVLQATDMENDDHRASAMSFVGTLKNHGKKTDDQVYGSGTGEELNKMFRTLAEAATEELKKELPPAEQNNKDILERKRLQGEKKARDLILNNVQGFTKGIVYTPHPTELLNDKAIEAQENLMAVLTDMREFFKLKGGNDGEQIYMDHKVRPRLKAALEELAGAIQEPVSKQLVIGQEMRRSVRFAQREFDSIPGIVDTLLAATRSPVSSQLSMKELSKFGHLLNAQTWSPGDQDSKPDMTVDKLQEGIDLNRRAIMFHYFRTLTALGSNVNNISEDTEKRIYTIMHRLLKTGCDAYDPPKTPDIQLARNKLIGISEANTNGRHNVSDRFGDLADHDFFMKFEDKKNFGAMSAQAKPYENAEEFVRDLANLRQIKQVSDIRDKGDERKPKRKCITVVDSLIVQAMNFGESALRVQVRQNAAMHAQVLDTLIERLSSRTLPAGIKDLHSERDSSSIEKLLGAFKSDMHFREAVQKEVRKNLALFRALPPEGAADYKEKKEQLIMQLGEEDVASGRIAKEKLARLPKKSAANYEEERAKLVYAAGDRQYEMYQTLGTMGLATRNSGQIPRYLIAECRSKTDMLEAFFLLKVMESIEAPDRKQKVEIVNLVEHPDLAIDAGNGIPAVNMTRDAMQNGQFREHHLSIHSSDNLLNSYSYAKGEHRLTVAEAKRTYGIKVEEGDETREIKGVKMMMGAGSDITKAGSVAAAAMMMNIMQKSRAALLNDKENPVLLIDYIGCGGGIHRSQPVSSAHETVQGNSMRQSPENIGQKTLSLITPFLHRHIAMNPDKDLSGAQGQGGKILAKVMTTENRKKVAQLNMGNMAGLPQDEHIWQHFTRPRTEAMMHKYGELYNSKEFEAMMSYSANMFADMTKFAARPSERKGAPKKAKGFLAPVDVKETRAIGFGLALNVAGIYAPMFFGGSEYLKAQTKQEEMDLLNIYMRDPNAQDTINRMTQGIIMTDMNIAWKYQGRAHPPTHAELVKLASAEIQVKDAEKPTREETHAMSEKSLARIHLEYDKVAGQLLRLQQLIHDVPYEQLSEITDGAQAAKKLLALRPIAIREQRSLSLNNIQTARESLADMFMDMVNGKIDPKTVTIDSEAYKTIIYPSMATCAEDIEHTDRGYTKPKWGKAVQDILMGTAGGTSARFVDRIFRSNDGAQVSPA